MSKYISIVLASVFVSSIVLAIGDGHLTLAGRVFSFDEKSVTIEQEKKTKIQIPRELVKSKGFSVGEKIYVELTEEQAKTILSKNKK